MKHLRHIAFGEFGREYGRNGRMWAQLKSDPRPKKMSSVALLKPPIFLFLGAVGATFTRNICSNKKNGTMYQERENHEKIFSWENRAHCAHASKSALEREKNNGRGF